MNIRAAVLVLILLVTQAVSAAGEKEAAATAAALAWLGLVDRHEYEASWEEAAALFRSQVSSADWVVAATAVRMPLGDVVGERHLLSAHHMTELSGAPDGDYVVLQFQTEFSNKARAIETVTPMLDGAQWRVSGYYIK